MPAGLSPGRFAAMWFVGGVGTVVALAVLTGITLKDHGWLGYWRLVHGGASIQGVVVRTEPGNHCLAEYKFTIGGNSYFGGGPDCGVTVGQAVEVTYLVADPSHSCLGSARARLHNELATFVLGGIIFPPLVILGIRARRNPNREKSGVP